MISLNSPAFLNLNKSLTIEIETHNNRADNFANHKLWNYEGGWKNTLNNLRLILQPLLVFWLIYLWLDIFPNSNLLLGFNHLIAKMNQFKHFYASG